MSLRPNLFVASQLKSGNQINIILIWVITINDKTSIIIKKIYREIFNVRSRHSHRHSSMSADVAGVVCRHSKHSV